MVYNYFINKNKGVLTMGNYLYSKYLTRDMVGEGSCRLKDLKTLLDNTKELDKEIIKQFPISYFGDENESLNVVGAKALIDSYDQIDSEKMDIVASFNNIEFVGINEKKQIFLNFNVDDDTIETHSMYDFYNDFLDEEFHIAKYIEYCVKNNYNDLVKMNIEGLLSRKDDIKQYRLLRDTDDTWGVRGKTSSDYKNYDNNVALYLSLLAFHKYTKEKGKKYHMSYSYITDSSLYIFFEHDDPVSIPEIGDIYLGLAISNGEIRNYKFQAELRYRIVNTNNNSSFSAISSNSVFSIFHRNNVVNLEKQIEKLFALEVIEDEMISFIKSLNISENLSEDTLYSILKGLLDKLRICSDISAKTKDEFKKIEINNLIRGTYNLIDFFGKLRMIPTDVDEQIFIERIFHRVIFDLKISRDN